MKSDRLFRNLAGALVLTQVIGLQVSREVRRVHADSTAAGFHLSAARAIAAVYQGSPEAVQMLRPGFASAVSMASGDFDMDGVGDLAAGYATPQAGGLIAIHRGNLNAYAPQSAAGFQAIANGDIPQPYLPEAAVVQVPVRPDFLAAGDVFGQRGTGLVIGARGGSTIAVLARNASGKMEVVQSIAAAGAITALSTHQLQAGKYAQVVVGAHGPNGPELDIYSGSNQGLSQVASFALAGDATGFASGNLDGDGSPDVLVMAGGGISILHGASQTMEPVRVPYTVSAAVLGRFLFDRNGMAQIALLASDGSVHVLARSGLDARPFTTEEARAARLAAHQHSTAPVPATPEMNANWTEMENYPAVATFGPGGQSPMMFRTRISSNGADDILLLSGNQASLVEHTDVNPDSGVVINRSDLAVNAAAALPARLNFSGQPGLVYIPNRGITPIAHIAGGSTFYPNRTDDPTPPADLSTICTNGSNSITTPDCSLREAVLKANADTGNTDTIMLASTTYTLSIAKVAGDYSGKFGALYVNNSMNIVGAGQLSTVIQGGASVGHGVDLVIAVNEDITAPGTTATASISDLTIQFGTNKGTLADGNGDQDGGGMEFDTGKLGTSNLTMTDVTLNQNQTTDGDGGGIALFSSLVQNAGGHSTFSGCSILENQVSRAAGFGAQAGGIWASDTNNVPVVTTLTGTVVTDNKTNGTGGIGGGIKFDGPANGNTQSAIHGGIISDNTSTAEGGGIYTNAGLTIDTEAVISGNSAGTSGGGIWMDISPDTATLTDITVTGNYGPSGGGGGIHVDASGGTVTITDSRLTGNSATTGGDNLDSTASGNATKVTATDDWWGTNSPASFGISPSTSTCPATAGTICFSLYITLTNSASPQIVKLNGTSTVTASVGQDSGNTSVVLGVLVGLPLGGDIFSPGHTNPSISNDLETIQMDGTVTETYTAGASPATVTINAILDNATVPATIYVVAPPTITKSFSPNPVVPSGTTTLTFGLNNPNTTTIDASFTDTLPSGMAVAANPNLSNTCGGSVTAAASATSVGFTIASLPVGACTIKVDVTAPATDQIAVNTVTLDSTAAGNSNSASSSLTVINPPSITKTFANGTLVKGSNTMLTFVISNVNASSTINGIAFTDTLPAGLAIAATPSLTNTCSGGTPSATGGGSSVALSGGSLVAGGICLVTVTVTANAAGAQVNSVTVTSTNAGTGNTSMATLTVAGPPTLTKAFGAASIPVGGSTSLTFTLNNPNAATPLTGVGFIDALPAGLIVASPNGLLETCNGTISASASSISLSGATLASGAGCNFSVNVIGISSGVMTNTTSTITSNEAGNGTTATAQINVVAPPSIAKSFSPNSIVQNATTTLTFTVTNPAGNPASLSGVGFTDTLPTGLTVASGTSSQCGGTLTVTAPVTIQLAGATVATGTPCTFPVTVTGASSGQYTNTTGAVTSTNGGTGGTASAGLTVVGADLAMGIANAGNFSQGQIGDTFTLTVSNVGSGSTNGSLVTVTDTMPSGFTTTSIGGSGWNCTLATLQCTRTDVLGGGLSYSPITIAVNVNSNATTPETNTATVSGGGPDANPVNNTASDTITVGQPSQVTLTGLITARSGPANARVWTVTVTNTAATTAANTQITGMTLTQTLGTACTPVIDTAFPVTIGSIGASSTGSGNITIDFSSCTGVPRFKVTAAFVANSGSNTGSMTLSNQVQ